MFHSGKRPRYGVKTDTVILTMRSKQPLYLQHWKQNETGNAMNRLRCGCGRPLDE